VRITAKQGETIAGIPAGERSMMYALALTTGLRAGELQSLTRASFMVSGDKPHVIVEAAYSKHRRRDEVPLRSDVAGYVRAYLAETGRDVKLFRRPASNGTRALRVDLEAAGIEYCVDGKFADFHSQRHTFVSNLFDSGATPKEAQTLARHQDPRLTLGRYAHVAAAQRAAIERLPAP
jgi:integrase